MSNVKKLLMSGAAGGAGLDVDEVFDGSTYTGTDSTLTVNNGIDLSGEGGLVWVKNRGFTLSGTTGITNSHMLVDTESGASNRLLSNDTDGYVSAANFFSSFNSNGFTVGTNMSNGFSGGHQYVAWTFRKAEKFFDIVTYTGNQVSGRTVSHNLGSTPGMIITKKTDSSEDWTVWHRDLNTNSGGNYTQFIKLNDDNSAFGGTGSSASTCEDVQNVSDTTFTIGNDNRVNTNNATYVSYLFAHHNNDGVFGPSSDQDIIKCGTYTGNNSANGPTVSLGFEPQWIVVRKLSGFGCDWYQFDQSRAALTAKDTNDLYLRFNRTNGEDGSLDYISLRPDGFQVHGTGGHTNASADYVYMAIRRGPLAVPTSATDVFDATTYTSDNTDRRVITVGNKVDLLVARNRTETSERGFVVGDRVRGSYLESQFSPKYLSTALSNNEASDTDALMGFDFNTGFKVGNDSTRRLNFSNYTQIAYTWTRAPSFCDIVNYQGTGSAQNITHNLGVVPEMIWVKRRESSGNWHVYHSAIGNTGKLDLNTTNAVSTSSGPWNDTSPTASVFTVGTSNNTNVSGEELIAYLFATVAGISKVGSFTGTAATQTIDCGFSSGARFVLIKETNTTGGWMVFDTERGIVSGNDARLELDDTGAESTAFDILDPHSSGFQLPSSSFVNASGRECIFYAIA